MTSCQKISFAASPLLAADRTTSGRHEPRIPQTARRNGLGFPRPRFGPRPKRPKNTKQTYSMALLMYCLYLLLSAYSPSRNSRAKVAYLSFGRKRKRERERERKRESWDLGEISVGLVSRKYANPRAVNTFRIVLGLPALNDGSSLGRHLHTFTDQ